MIVAVMVFAVYISNSTSVWVVADDVLDDNPATVDGVLNDVLEGEPVAEAEAEVEVLELSRRALFLPLHTTMKRERHIEISILINKKPAMMTDVRQSFTNTSWALSLQHLVARFN
jgi:hypothetical protein